VDFEPGADQQAILEAVEQLLARHAGPERAIALAVKAEYDAPLEDALAEAGFLGLARGDETGPLEAALLVEAVARAGGVVGVGAAALVAPLLVAEELPRPVALLPSEREHPVRYAAHARSALRLEADGVGVLSLEPGDAEAVASNFGFPMGRVPGGRERARLGPKAAERLRAWWRVALAAELAGCMRAALDTTLDYVKKRRQFGRAIGSFQGVQHRLAQLHVAVEGSRWLALEAAHSGAPSEGAAIAAAHAVRAARQVFDEAHQFSGAMGFTREHDLHVWSMRLQALRLELGGAAAHGRAAASERWAGGA
jgi:alkylation response protein AidB-like acyl-CoA dehydrogenase